MALEGPIRLAVFEVDKVTGANGLRIGTRGVGFSGSLAAPRSVALRYVDGPPSPLPNV